MKNAIALIIVIAILTLAIIYIVRQKKKGVKCISCPYSDCCSGKKTCDCKSE